MTEDEKRKFESISHLYDRSWEQFNKRRDYEFKISVALWTALAVSVAGSAKLGGLPRIPGGRISLCCLSVAAFVLHLIWCYGIGEAQRKERLIAISYERKLQGLTDAFFDDKLEKELKPLRKRMGLLTNWTYVFQLGVTLLLCSSFVLVNWGTNR